MREGATTDEITPASPRSPDAGAGARVLNLGCGSAKLDFPGAARAAEIVGVDLSPRSQADVIHDLDRFPYPLESDSFDLVVMQDILEHLEDVPSVLREVHRVARDGALVRIRTPHYSSYYAYNDPTHIRSFGVFALDGFDVGKPRTAYADPLFRIRKREILFPLVWRMSGVAALANRFPGRWEQLFAFVFRAENLFFELEVVKSRGPQGPAA
jgi:SAM-dependent methyltransferase